MTETVVNARVSQRSKSDLSFEVERATHFDGFNIGLLDNETEVFSLYLRDEYGYEDLADSFIKVGLALKRFIEQQEYEAFDELMEEIAQEDERRERELHGEEVLAV